MKTNYTPGPWVYAPTGDTMKSYSQPYGIAEYNKPNLIAGCFGDVKGGEKTAEANARLISCAPKMYERLEESLNVFQTIVNDLSKGSLARIFVENEIKYIQQTLSKATGESLTNQ